MPLYVTYHPAQFTGLLTPVNTPYYVRLLKSLGDLDLRYSSRHSSKGHLGVGDQLIMELESTGWSLYKPGVMQPKVYYFNNLTRHDIFMVDGREFVFDGSVASSKIIYHPRIIIVNQ